MPVRDLSVMLFTANATEEPKHVRDLTRVRTDYLAVYFH